MRVPGMADVHQPWMHAVRRAMRKQARTERENAHFSSSMATGRNSTASNFPADKSTPPSARSAWTGPWSSNLALSFSTRATTSQPNIVQQRNSFSKMGSGLQAIAIGLEACSGSGSMGGSSTLQRHTCSQGGEDRGEERQQRLEEHPQRRHDWLDESEEQRQDVDHPVENRTDGRQSALHARTAGG